jgi:NADP-dependent 3-hydroxy acid dehydrogenase YdfG
MATSNKTESCRVWFITGASSGVGRAIAVAALDRGDRVVATARKPEALTELISHYPDRVLLAELDVRREDEAQQATGEAVAAFGGIDVVVNSAGYGLFEPVEKRQISRLEIYSTPTFLGCLTCCAQRCRYFEDSVQVM